MLNVTSPKFDETFLLTLHVAKNDDDFRGLPGAIAILVTQFHESPGSEAESATTATITINRPIVSRTRGSFIPRSRRSERQGIGSPQRFTTIARSVRSLDPSFSDRSETARSRSSLPWETMSDRDHMDPPAPRPRSGRWVSPRSPRRRRRECPSRPRRIDTPSNPARYI